MSDLNWIPAFNVEHETLVASVNRADLGTGNILHSIRIARKGVNGGKPSQFLRVDDLGKLAELAIKTSTAILVDVNEQRKK